MKIKITYLTIGSSKVKNKTRIFHASDLHGNAYLTASMIPIIKEANPNTLCITGDIVETSRDSHAEIVKTLEEVSSSYKTYYVSGNHDDSYKDTTWKYEKNNKLHHDLKNINVELLENNKPKIDEVSNVCFNGYNIPYKYYTAKNGGDSLEEIYNKDICEIPNDYYNILLTHVDQLKKTRNELILSGHYHNGIVKLPFNTGLIRPGKGGIIPCYPIQLRAHGVIKKYNSIHVINGALSKVASNFINAILHPDLVVIDLIPYPASDNIILSKKITNKRI